MGLSTLISSKQKPKEVSFPEYLLLEGELGSLEYRLTEEFLSLGYDSLVANEYKLGIYDKYKPILKTYRDSMMENYFIKEKKLDPDYNSNSKLKESDKVNKYPSFSYFAHLTKFYQVQTGDQRKYRSPIQVIDVFDFVEAIPKIQFTFDAYSYEKEFDIRKAWSAAFHRQAWLDAVATARRETNGKASKYSPSTIGDGGGYGVGYIGGYADHGGYGGHGGFGGHGGGGVGGC